MGLVPPVERQPEPTSPVAGETARPEPLPRGLRVAGMAETGEALATAGSGLRCAPRTHLPPPRWLARADALMDERKRHVQTRTQAR